jgi:hypothetical protein
MNHYVNLMLCVIYVIDAWSATHGHEKIALKALSIDILQTKVIIVLVVVAKVLRTISDRFPGRLVEGHSHIVLARFPRCDIHQIERFLIQNARVLAQRDDVTVGTLLGHFLLHELVNVQKVFGDVIVFLE